MSKITDMASVNSHGVAFNLANWETYDASESRKVAFLLSEISEEIRCEEGCLITRGYVRQAFSQSYLKGVIATVIWGYPKGRFPGGKSFSSIFAKAEAIANKLEKLKGSDSLSAMAICFEFDNFRDLGPSTYTKMLCFADIVATEGACLIYDQMVMRAISEAVEPQWASIKRLLGSCRYPNGKFRSYHRRLQVGTYGGFLSITHSLATAALSPEAIELELFMSAPRGRPTQHQKG